MAGPFYEQGRYLCRVIGQGLGSTKTGNPQIIIRVKVLEREDGDHVPSQYERTIYRVVTEKSLPYAIKDLAALGYSREGFRYIDPAEPNHHSFIGQEQIFICAHEPDPNGAQREKWGIPWESSGDFEIKKPLDAKAIRSLDALFGKQLKEGLASVSVVQPPRRAAAPDPSGHITDDDLPF